MDNQIKITFLDSSIMTCKGKSFLEICKLCFVPSFFNRCPLKMHFLSTDKILYFDWPLFKSYIDGDLSQPDLIAGTQCQGLFRNKVDIELTKHDIIDAGSLFKLNNQTFILIDQERYVPIAAPDPNFEEI